MNFVKRLLSPISRKFVLLTFLSYGLVSGAFAQSPASDLTVCIQELENGDVEFSLSGTAHYKQASGTPYRTPTDSGAHEPPHTLEDYEYFTIPEGLTLTVPDNDPMPAGPTREASLIYLEFNSSGYWSFYSFYTGNLNMDDAIVGGGSVVTDAIPFENFEPGTYVVEGHEFDMIYKVLPYSPPQPPELRAPSTKAFPDTRLRRSSRVAKIVVKNVGEESVEGLRIKVRGRSARDFRIRKRPGSTIEGGKSTTMKASFRPRAAGKRRAKVLLMSNAPTERFILTGRGLRSLGTRSPRFPNL